MNKLILEYKLLSHPYPDEPSSKFDIWARYSIKVIDVNNVELETAFNIEWDLKAFIDWLKTNKEAILYERYPLASTYNSIAECIYWFYESINENDESLVDNNEFQDKLNTLFEYREKHDIKLGLSGTKIKSVFIGIYNRISTISCYQDDVKWSYEFDANTFFKSIDTIANEIS